MIIHTEHKGNGWGLPELLYVRNWTEDQERPGEHYDTRLILRPESSGPSGGSWD